MSTGTATDSDLPIYTHTHVLGCDIGVNQRDTERGAYQGHTTREGAVEIAAYGDGLPLGARSACRRYIAAWARRTLFATDGESA